jgi:GrpB-like predicted nucleotidyltransferase (UPF0157 family)
MDAIKIVIADYDPNWPAMFITERSRLLSSIGQWTAAIEHIGSTSVPGLAAKPVIDIMIGVHKLADADAHCIGPICALGYEYVQAFESVMPFRRYFRRNAHDNVRTHQIHLVEIASEFWERHLVFRDYLRTHPDDAWQYEQLKRDLAPKFTDVNDYADAKTAFIKATEAKAWVWKRSV